MSDQSLFKVDSITVDGVAIAFVEGTAIINGAGDYTSTVVPSGNGPDYEQHTRVPRTIELDIQFGRNVNPEDLKKINGARVVMKDSRGPRRCLANSCSFGSLGALGGTSTKLTLNVLEKYQWL